MGEHVPLCQNAGGSGRMFAEVIKIWSNLFKMLLCLVEIFSYQT